MDIDDMQGCRTVMERQIKDCILQFEKDTGLVVYEINLRRRVHDLTTFGAPVKPFTVEAEVRL